METPLGNKIEIWNVAHARTFYVLEKYILGQKEYTLKNTRVLVKQS